MTNSTSTRPGTSDLDEQYPKEAAAFNELVAKGHAETLQADRAFCTTSELFHASRHLRTALRAILSPVPNAYTMDLWARKAGVVFCMECTSTGKTCQPAANKGAAACSLCSNRRRCSRVTAYQVWLVTETMGLEREEAARFVNWYRPLKSAGQEQNEEHPTASASRSPSTRKRRAPAHRVSGDNNSPRDSKRRATEHRQDASFDPTEPTPQPVPDLQSPLETQSTPESQRHPTVQASVQAAAQCLSQSIAQPSVQSSAQSTAQAPIVPLTQSLLQSAAFRSALQAIMPTLVHTTSSSQSPPQAAREVQTQLPQQQHKPLPTPSPSPDRARPSSSTSTIAMKAPSERNFEADLAEEHVSWAVLKRKRLIPALPLQLTAGSDTEVLHLATLGDLCAAAALLHNLDPDPADDIEEENAMNGIAYTTKPSPAPSPLRFRLSPSQADSLRTAAELTSLRDALASHKAREKCSSDEFALLRARVSELEECDITTGRSRAEAEAAKLEAEAKVRGAEREASGAKKAAEFVAGKWAAAEERARVAAELLRGEEVRRAEEEARRVQEEAMRRQEEGRRREMEVRVETMEEHIRDLEKQVQKFLGAKQKFLEDSA